MTAEADDLRQAMVAIGTPAVHLAGDEGRRWSTEEMQADFEPLGFAAPFIVVRRRSDGVKGSLEFTHSPRVYFGWKEDR